ncbi:hypothetical protein [Streptomyces sp. PR69]|nr:hypothetical protein [Streptomyces sp. PR69]
MIDDPAGGLMSGPMGGLIGCHTGGLMGGRPPPDRSPADRPE